MPADDKYFLAAADFVIKNLGQSLKDSQVVYMAYYHHDETYNYRMIFSGLVGRHETIVSTDSNLNVAILKWEKLEDGYALFSMDDVANQ